MQHPKAKKKIATGIARNEQSREQYKKGGYRNSGFLDAEDRKIKAIVGSRKTPEEIRAALRELKDARNLMCPAPLTKTKSGALDAALESTYTTTEEKKITPEKSNWLKVYKILDQEKLPARERAEALIELKTTLPADQASDELHNFLEKQITHFSQKSRGIKTQAPPNRHPKDKRAEKRYNKYSNTSMVFFFKTHQNSFSYLFDMLAPAAVLSATIALAIATGQEEETFNTMGLGFNIGFLAWGLGISLRNNTLDSQINYIINHPDRETEKTSAAAVSNKEVSAELLHDYLAIYEKPLKWRSHLRISSIALLITDLATNPIISNDDDPNKYIIHASCIILSMVTLSVVYAMEHWRRDNLEHHMYRVLESRGILTGYGDSSHVTHTPANTTHLSPTDENPLPAEQKSMPVLTH